MPGDLHWNYRIIQSNIDRSDENIIPVMFWSIFKSITSLFRLLCEWPLQTKKLLKVNVPARTPCVRTKTRKIKRKQKRFHSRLYGQGRYCKSQRFVTHFCSFCIIIPQRSNETLQIKHIIWNFNRNKFMQVKNKVLFLKSVQLHQRQKKNLQFLFISYIIHKVLLCHKFIALY